jgi:hypothetical protein
MKRTLALSGLLALVAALLAGADLTGQWKGSFEGGGETRNVVFDLKSDGTAVTGTVGGLSAPGNALELKDGKLAGDKLSFWFTTEYNGGDIKLVCTGQVAGGEIKFTIGLDDGSWSTDFVAKKS